LQGRLDRRSLILNILHFFQRFFNPTFSGDGTTSSSSELSESDLSAGLMFTAFGVTALTVAAEISFGFGGTSESLSELELAAFLPVCGLATVGLTGGVGFCRNKNEWRFSKAQP
jgi:hypothetical protein